MKRIYLSGPMTGIPDWNFPAFNAEASRLRGLGYDVVNPVDINPDTATPYNECLRRDMLELMTCDTIAMLDGWMDSNGAHLEMHVAHRVGIKVVEARTITEPATRVGDIVRAEPDIPNFLDLHPDTMLLVRQFAYAMADKLHRAEQKYGYSDGWKSPDWMDECREKLRAHLAKGDPLDVANYCAFLWYHGEATTDTEYFDLIGHLRRQIIFSHNTFGPGDRAAGVVDHIRKELVEIEADPNDLSEWIDVVLLAFDGAWRQGYTPEQITATLAAKQAKNEARKWPDWRTAEPGKAIQHVREAA